MAKKFSSMSRGVPRKFKRDSNTDVSTAVSKEGNIAMNNDWKVIVVGHNAKVAVKDIDKDIIKKMPSSTRLFNERSTVEILKESVRNIFNPFFRSPDFE